MHDRAVRSGQFGRRSRITVLAVATSVALLGLLLGGATYLPGHAHTIHSSTVALQALGALVELVVLVVLQKPPGLIQLTATQYAEQVLIGHRLHACGTAILLFVATATAFGTLKHVPTQAVPSE